MLTRAKTDKPKRYMKCWQLNAISNDVVTISRKLGVSIGTDRVYLLTGYITRDDTKKFEEGWHFTSTVVLGVNGREVETSNTIYVGEDDMLDADMGALALDVFY